MPDVHKHQTPEMHDCIHHCRDCHDLCVHTAHDCLHKGGKHADAKHIGLLLDCAGICALSADFMLRHSELHAVTCHACAEICEACAKSCEATGDTDCAEACRRCADSCRSMSGGAPHTHTH